MNEIWANRLVAGTKAWAEVPSTRKSAVKGVLQNRVASGAVTAERYEEITEEVYEAE